MKKIIEDFKEVLHQGMIDNFKKDGYLSPIMFFIKNNQPAITLIPEEMLATHENKLRLAGIMRMICNDPMVTFMGLIIEGYASRMHQDSELTKLILNGDMKVSELKEKDDVIIMVYGTPEEEGSFSYVVDPKTHTVGEKFSDDETKGIGGVFSNFFNARKN